MKTHYSELLRQDYRIYMINPCKCGPRYKALSIPFFNHPSHTFSNSVQVFTGVVHGNLRRDECDVVIRS